MPFDPTLSNDPTLRKQYAPEIAQQADHERQVLQYQKEQERAQAAADRATAQDQRDIDRQNKIATNIQAESDFRATGRKFHTSADGMLRPDVDDATHAAQQVTATQRADQEIQYKQEGRKFTKNALTGDLVPLESDEILAQRGLKEADDLRRESITQQMESLKAEAALRPGPMKTKERGDLETDLKENRNLAKIALANKLQEKAKLTDKAGFWDVVNNQPTPEATAAQTRLERLMLPDAYLDDNDLADLEADPATAPTVASLRTLKDKLALDDEARAARQQTGQTLAEMHLRRTDPAKWEEHQRQKLAKLDGPALDAHLATSDEALKTKAADLEARQQAVNAPQQQWQQKHAELEQKNAQAKQTGIPAGELVTFTDGSTWHSPLAKELFDIQAQSQAHEGDPEVAKQRKILEIDAAELQREAKLLSEAAKMRQQKGQETAKVQADVRRFTPGFEKAAEQIQNVTQDADARLSVVSEMYPQDSAERQAAVKAIQDDVSTQAQAAEAQGQQTQAAVTAAYQGIKQRLYENPDLKATAGDLFITARKNLSQSLGISEAEANNLLEDVESQDWSSIQGKHGEDFGPGTGAAQFMHEAAGDKRQFRLLKNGGLMINPVITDPAAYAKAVEASPASPEAKAAAMAVQPDLRQRYGAQALETLNQIGDSDWQKFSAAQKDVSPEEAAALYADKLKTETGTSGKVLRAIFQSMAQGVDDIGAQALGLVSGMSGSETLMKGATALNERSQLIEADKQMRGAAGNFALDTTGQFSRLLPSLIPAAGGAKIAQTGLALFARTGIAARMLPGLVAGLKAASTPAQAAKATAAFTQAGVAGAAVAGGAQTYGAQISDIYTSLRREHPEMDHATALRQAQVPALLSGAMTAILTTVGGATGVERLLANPAAVKEAFKKQFTSRLAQAGFIAKAVATGGLKEWPEEIADEVFSQVAAAVGTGKSVPQALAQFAESLPELSAAILLLGGLGEGTQAARESSYQPEVTAAAWAAIENLEQLESLKDWQPEEIELMKNRAAVALALGQDPTSVEDLEEWQLRAVGWTRENSKGQTMRGQPLVALKGYTGKPVLEVDTDGNITIAPSYRTDLEQHLPAVAAAIPSLSPAPAQSDGKAATPEAAVAPPTQQPRGSSAQGAAPAAVDAGGEPQAGAGAVSPAPAAGSPEEARAQALAVILEERGLTPEQAQAAAQHVVSRQGVQGATAEAQYAAGIDDAMREKNWIRGSGKKYTFVPPTPDAQPETVSPPVASQNTATRIVDGGVEWSDQDAGNRDLEVERAAEILHQNEEAINKDGTYTMPAINGQPMTLNQQIQRNRYLNAANILMANGFSEKGADAALDTLGFSFGGDTQQGLSPAKPTTEDSSAVAASDATPPAPAPQAPVKPTPGYAIKAVGEKPTRKLTLVEEDRAQQLAIRLAKGQDYTDEESVALAEEYVAQSAENHQAFAQQWRFGFLNWLARKETAARGGKLYKGKTAVTENSAPSTSNRAPDLVEETPDRPADLRAHPAWARNRLAALSSLPADRRPAARLQLNALERALAQNHALFTTLALGPKDIARSIIGEGSMAVQEMDGQIVLALDLGRLLDQMKNTTTPEAGMTAALVEEAIHAAVLRLAKKNPGKYGLAALVKRWQSLTPELRQKVWESYHAVDIQNGTHKKTLPATMKDGQQWALMNEFLRMLVQDKAFAGQVSEVAAQDKGLAQWIVDALKDLAQALKDLITKASPEVQAELNSMVDEIAVTVKQFQVHSLNTQIHDNRVPLRSREIPAGRDSVPPASGISNSTNQSNGTLDVGGGAEKESNVPPPRQLLSAPDPDARPLEEIFPNAALGKSIELSTPDFQTLNFRVAVVEANAGDTIPSMDFQGNPRADFPIEDLQPRETKTDKNSQVKRDQIATNSTYRLLSHPGGGIREGAPKVSRNKHVFVGNHRDVAIDHAYANPERYPNIRKYESDLRADAANWGIDPAKLAGIKHPKLIFILEDNADLSYLAEMGNAEMGPVDQAYQDAKDLGPGLVLLNPTAEGRLPGSSNSKFFQWFEDNLVHDSNQKGRFRDENLELAPPGLERVQNALLAYTYGKTPAGRKLVSSMIGMISEENANLKQVLATIAPTLADLKARIKAGDLYELDLSQDLAWAGYTFTRMRTKGESVEAILNPPLIQEEVYTPPTPLQESILRFLDATARSAPKLRDAFIRYSGAVIITGDPKQASLFGDEPRPTREELFALATGKTFTQEEAEGWRKLAEKPAAPIAPPAATAVETSRKPQATLGNQPETTGKPAPAPNSQPSTLNSQPLPPEAPQPPSTPPGKSLSTAEAAAMHQKRSGITDRDALAKLLEQRLSLRPFAAQSMAEAVLNDLSGGRVVPASRQGYTGPQSQRYIFGAKRMEGPGADAARARLQFEEQQRNNVPSNKRGEWIPEDEYRQAGGKPARPWQTLAKGTIAPKNALKLYRTLTAKQAEAPLTPGQSKALEQAEISLGQTFLFDDPSTSILKPAEDLMLERQTTGQPLSNPEQLALFMSSKAPDPRLVEKFGTDWQHGYDAAGFPNMPVTLPDGHALLQPTEHKTTATLQADHPLVTAGMLPAGKEVPRKVLHNAIVAYFMRQAKPLAAGVQPTVYAMAGGGGAGKSAILGLLKATGAVDTSNAVEINADDIKELIPEFEALKQAGDGRAAATVHEESSQLSTDLMDRAIPPGGQSRYNVVFDGTLSNGEKSRDLIARWQASGMRVHLIGVTIDPREAITRAVLRGAGSGRWVPSAVLVQAHEDFNRHVKSYLPLVDAVDLYDNTPPKAQLIAKKTGRAQEVSIENTAIWAILSRRQEHESNSEKTLSESPSSERADDSRNRASYRLTPLREVQSQGTGDRSQDTGETRGEVSPAPDWPQMLAQVNDMTVQEFAELAATGKLNQSTGKPSPFPVGSMKTPLAIGAAEGYPLRDIAHFYLARRTPRETTPADLVASSNTDAAEVPQIVTAFDEFANDGYSESQTPALHKGRTAVDDGPDLFSFNSGLGLDTLLTPAQKEAKVQQDNQLSLFGDFTDARSRPTPQRPSRTPRPSRPQESLEPAAGFGDLFGQTGMAPATGGNGPLGGELPGLTGGSGGSGTDADGGGTTRQPGADTSPGNDTQDGTGADMPGLPGDAGGLDAFSVGDRVTWYGVSGPITGEITSFYNGRLMVLPDNSKSGKTLGVDPAKASLAGQMIARPPVGDPARNFEVPDNVENLAPATDKAKILANIEAIRLLKELEENDRHATTEEKTKLAAYTGWGAFKEAFNSKYEEAITDIWDRLGARHQYMPDWLQSWEKNHRPLHKLLRENMTEDEFASASASTLNAHYTAAPIIRAMWKMVEKLGFTGGRALEPSAGNGHYLGLTPSAIADKTQWQTVELDDLSARLLSKLYPEATVNEARGAMEGRQVTGLGFERARIPNGSLDLIISNVPFHESGPKKKGFPNLNLHNFFFAHALDKVKPGGLVAFITSESTMQNNMKQRDFIASKGDLVAAFRLPNNAFKGNAGTEVTTDIIILRKPDGKPFQGKAWRNLIETGRQTITLVQGKDQTAEELRREAERTGEIVGKEYFKGGKKAIDVSAPIMVNEYFVNHPQHALGTHTLASTMYRAGGYALVAPDDLDVPAVLSDLASTLTPLPVSTASPADTPDIVLAGRDDKPFSFKEQDGKLYEVQPDGSMEEAEWSTNPEMVKTWRSWKRVSETVEQLVTAEAADSFTEEGLDQMRRSLNIVYDTHIATHKPISRRFANAHKYLTSDPGYPLTAALENEVVSVDPKTGKKTYTYKKAEIFTKRIGRPIVIPTKATSVDEALEMSLAWKGHIDPAYGASLLGSTVERFEMESLQRPDIFRNPETGTLEQGEEYLSGNVRQKLEAAQEAAKDDPAYQRNVEALTTAQPERKEIARISPVLGARWIPAPVYNAFIKEVLQGNDSVEYIPAGNSWIISGSGVYSTEEHGTERQGPFTLFKHALNMTEPLVYDGSGEDRTFNPSATAAAKVALDKMRRAFIDFVKTSDIQVTQEDRADGPSSAVPVWQLTEDAFNESNNSYVTPKHTGAYLKFPGLNTDYVYTKAHRRGVIARFLTTRRGMMAHGVGSGKTFNQIILAQEMRRLGLAKKPMIVVQNSTLGQFAKSYLKAYPAAKILVPTKADFQAQNRRKLVAKIATGNWDAIILPHSQFDLISNKDSAVKAYMDSQIDELMAIVNSTKDKAKVRDLEGMIKRLKDRRQGMLDQLKARQDTAVMWEDLGIDALIMDEAHNYKSLPIITRMGRVKGVPASGNSQRAINFMLKCRDVQSRTGGKNIFLATGTPIKNSMAEAYIMMQFMAPDILEAFHIHNFDDFATTYGQSVTEAEMAWGGTPKMETRFAKFQNGSALVTMIRTMFDVAFGNDKLGLDVPKIKGGEPEMVIVPATPAIDQFNAWTRNVNELWKKADPTEKEEYGAVPIQTMAAGIAAALDPRLLAPNVEDHPGSKVNEAVRRVSAIYKAGMEKKTTQIVFSDLRNPFSLDYLLPFTGHPFPDAVGRADGPPSAVFDLYTDLQRKLIASGVPAKEIHLMKSGMTDTAKAALFEKVDSGEIRIIIGSTELLGVGVNIQTRLGAVHHLMPPRDFTPAMMEQRNGRIIRQGNLHAEKVEGKPAWNEEVEVVNYGTEGSMDSAIYGTLARKQRFITQLLMGEELQDTFDDPTDPVAVNMAEMAARTLGDPDFIRRIELEKEIKDLRLQNEAFTNELSGKRSRLSRTEQLIRNGPQAIAEAEAYAESAAKLWKRTAPRPEGVREETDITDKPVYEFDGLTIDTAAKDGAITNRLGTWLLKESKDAERRGSASNYAEMMINGQPVKIRIDITIPNTPTGGSIIGRDGYTIDTYSGPDSLIQKLRRLPAASQEQVERKQLLLDQDTITARNLRALLANIGTFPEAEKLAALEREAQEVDARLREKSSPPPSESTAPAKEMNLPPMKPVDPGLMTYDVEQVIDNADIIGNKLFLPDTLDRKLYKAVNKALESAGGVWSRKDKAHLFAGDPRPYLGLAEMPTLAMSTKAVYSPGNDATARPDPHTGSPSFIHGRSVPASAAQAVYRHLERVLTGGGSAPGQSGAGGADSGSLRPPLVNLADFGFPGTDPREHPTSGQLEHIGGEAEASVYADRQRGVVYKFLHGFQGQGSKGAYPQPLYTAKGLLTWRLKPASSERALVARIALMNAVGGTPTEIIGITPQGHYVLKQPLSSDPETTQSSSIPEELASSGLIPIPPSVFNDPKHPPAWIAVHRGKPWLFTDLRRDNFVGDTQDAPRITDPLIAPIVANVFKNIPALRPLVQQAAQKSQQLGDRANRLFMSNKAVGSRPGTAQTSARQKAFDAFREARREAEDTLDTDRAKVRQGVEVYKEDGESFWNAFYRGRYNGLDYEPDGSFMIWFDEATQKWMSRGDNGFDSMPTSDDSFDAAADWVKQQFVEDWENQQTDRTFGQWERGKDEAFHILDSFIPPPGIESRQRKPWEGSGGLGPSGSIYGEFSPIGNEDVVWKLRIADHENTSFLHRPPNEQFIVAKHWAPSSVESAMQNAWDWLAKQKSQSTQATVLNALDAQSPTDVMKKTGQGENTTSLSPVNSLSKGSVSPAQSLPVSGAAVSQSPSPLAKLGWNHLDRSASAKLAALTRWTNETTKAGELVAKWQGAPRAAPFMKWGHVLKKELFPDSVLPREIAAKKREMEIKTAMGGQRAMDLMRALSGTPKFSDIAYPPEFAANPIWRTRLYTAMTGETPMTNLPAPLQALAAKLRAMLVEIGQEAVKQGRMSLDTFEMLREGYMPHFYKEDVAREKSLIQRFRLAVGDLLGARTGAWHIVDTQNRDRGTGDFRAIEWQPGKWRFRNKEHRDAHYEDFILQQALTQVQAMGGKNRTLTVPDLRAPAALTAETRGALDVIKRQLRQRYQKEAPLSLDAHQKAGLITDPVYAIARYAAQQAHDNSTAEFFNFVAANPDYISDVAATGFTEVPDNPRYGRLAGKYVTDDVAHQILEMIEAPGDALRAYDTILGWWKTGKTVLNPGTHVRNVLGNVFFSQLAGNSVWNPGNTKYYRDALRAMRNGGPDLMEAYDMGVLGADFVSVELRQTLRQLLPDPATIEEGKPLLGIGKSIGQFVSKVITNPTHKAYNQIAALYQAEDELFKLAAYLKAKEIFRQSPSTGSTPSTRAAEHVRHWFPYFDSGSSTTLRALGRTAFPFLGFYRESIRIFGHALTERPLALATGLAIPSIITVLSAMALGLDDDELEQVRKDMRGKGGKLLGPTPLGGVPLFSMLLPERSDQGALQQFDISAIHPFVDHLGNRVEGGEGEDWYQKTWRSFVAAGPIGSLIYSQMTGKDTFGDRTFVEQNMSTGEKILARVDNAWKTAMPPLAPGGTGFQSLMKAGERQTNKTFETRSPTQTVLRSVVGLDVRNATPNLYRIADDWRKANGYEVQEGMDYGSTTPTSRARAALFSVLAQDDPNPAAIANIKAALAKMGHPITSEQDVNRLLFYRDPVKVIGGDQKRGISAKEAQQQFQASLTGQDRATLAAAQAEYQKIKLKAPMLLLK